MSNKMLKIGVGTEDFETLIVNAGIYIDKTLFIRDILQSMHPVCLITRPRRFGKTLNLSTLNYFLTLENSAQNAQLFQNLAISQYPDIIAEHQGKYPVIFMTLKNFEEKSFEHTIVAFRDFIANIYRNFKYLLFSSALDDADKDFMKSIIGQLPVPVTILKRTLLNLTRMLHSHHGIKPIVLIDEYDAPLHASLLSNPPYYEEMVDFMSVFLGQSLKGNPSLHSAVVTGILNVGQTSLFSGLNNPLICTILNNDYSEYFGFTEPEVEHFFKLRNVPYQAELIKYWYNGYLIGNKTIYNPWSILKCIHYKGKTQSYWNETGETGVLGSILSIRLQNDPQYFTHLLNDQSIEVRIDPKVTLPDIHTQEKALWSLLLFTGYLKLMSYKEDEDGLFICHVAIPNREVKTAYRRWIRLWLESVPQNIYSNFLKSLNHNNISKFEEILSDYILESVSYFDLNTATPEISYHLFMLGILTGLTQTYKIISNREAGLGRYDIIAEPLSDKNCGYIFEFKTAQENEIEHFAQVALDQIKEKKYIAHFSSHKNITVYALGIAFSGKKVAIKSEKL